MSKALEELPDGTLLRYQGTLYVIGGGLDGRIVQNVADGTWHFLTERHLDSWKSFEVVYRPVSPEEARLVGPLTEMVDPLLRSCRQAIKESRRGNHAAALQDLNDLETLLLKLQAALAEVGSGR